MKIRLSAIALSSFATLLCFATAANRAERAGGGRGEAQDRAADERGGR